MAARALIFLSFVAVMAGCSEHREMAEAPMERISVTFTDFASLRRPDSPNAFLVAAAGQSLTAEADAVAPALNLPADRLAKAWVEVVSAQPRTRVLGVSGDGAHVEAEQRSAVFGFVDLISFHAVPLGPGQSTFFAYSRSQTGYWDFGVNRRRLTEWIAALEEEVEQTS